MWPTNLTSPESKEVDWTPHPPRTDSSEDRRGFRAVTITQKIDVVITRHRPLVEYLIEREIITPDTLVLEHAAPSDVRDRHVLGVLPHHLSCLCRTITEVPLSLTREDRAAMTRGDLPIERVREIAGHPVTYVVSRVDP